MFYRHMQTLRSKSEQHRNVNWQKTPCVSRYRHLRTQPKGYDKQIDIPISSSPVVFGSQIIIASEDGRIRSLRDFIQDDWVVRCNASFYSSPILMGQHSILAVTTLGLAVRVDLTGQIIWSRKLSDGNLGSPAYSESTGQVYVPLLNHKLVCLNSETGLICWQVDLSRPWFSKMSRIGYREPYSSVAVDSSGFVVIPCGEAVNSYTPEGQLNWTLRTDDVIKGTPALGENQIGIVGDISGRIYLFHSGSGEVRKVIKSSGTILSSPALSKNIACIGTDDGDVFGVCLSSMEALWKTRISAPLGYLSVTTLPDGSGFCLVNGRGNLVALCSKTGSFLWESSQHLNLKSHDCAIHTTPTFTDDGRAFAASYSGYVYELSADLLKEKQYDRG